MSKNLLKKGLALGTVLALGVTGLTGVAASAATGDVTIAPTSGTQYGAFSTDAFSVKTTVLTAAVSATTLAYKISNPDQHKLYIKIGGLVATSGATADASVILSGLTELGAAGDMDADTSDAQATATLAVVADGSNGAFATGAEDANFGEFLVDMEALNITELILSGIPFAGASNTIAIQPVENTIAADGYEVLTQTDETAGPIGATNGFDLGDGDASVSISSWVETQATADYSTVDAAYASATQTINWYDPKSTSVLPRIERYEGDELFLNDTTADLGFGASIQFTKPVNLSQVDIAKWKYQIDEADGTDVQVVTALATADQQNLVGYTNKDSLDRAYVHLLDGTFEFDAAKTYVLSVINAGTGAVSFSSVGYTAPSNAEAADQIQATVTDGDNALQVNSADTSIGLRTGQKAFTYKAQIKTADAVDSVLASVQVLAVVKAGAYLATGEVLTVSGASNTITKTNGIAISSGFTDSKGQYSVTVTAGLAAASEAYTVTFYVLNGATDAWVKVNLTAGTDAAYTATYLTAAATTLVPENTVLAGTSVTAKFTVKDQFGSVTALSGTKALSVELQGSSIANLDKDSVVAADGTASFTFTNYVTAGSSDVLTAKVYTGASTAPTFLTAGGLTKTLSLYNPGAAAAVNAPTSLSTTITYDDFITGTANTTTNVAPNDGSVALTGTVVDANGTGIPGAVVVIAGKGLQLQKNGSTDYYVDTVTFAADAAGAFNVNVFAHIASSTGTAVTITAGGKTATSTLKTYLPATLVNGNNLVFSWVLPAVLVKNTTYAVTAKLADKWGNPVATAVNGSVNGVTFQGFGSVEVNSSSAAVVKNFDKTGQVTVFLRSVKDIAGPGSVEATLGAANYSATSGASATALVVTEIASNATATKWDETAFKNILSANVEILDAAPASARVSSSVAGIKGYVATTVRNASGKAVTVTVNGRVLTPRAPNVAAQLFRFRAKAGKTTVVVKVDGVTVSSRTVMVK